MTPFPIDGNGAYLLFSVSLLKAENFILFSIRESWF